MALNKKLELGKAHDWNWIKLAELLFQATRVSSCDSPEGDSVDGSFSLGSLEITCPHRRFLA